MDFANVASTTSYADVASKHVAPCSKRCGKTLRYLPLILRYPSSHLQRWNESPRDHRCSWEVRPSRGENLGMRPLVAHCRLGLGKLYRRTDKREQARQHLATATTMYRETGMTYWLEISQVETAELEK
jgi:hypothetical protein